MSITLEQVRSFPSAAEALPAERAQFIRRTYAHLAGALGLFVALEYFLIGSPIARMMLNFISGFRYGWIMILGGFVLVGWYARGIAAGAQSIKMQYAGLALYTLAEAIIFLPILYLAVSFSSPDVLPSAALLTGLLFTGLTVVVFTTRKDFSFLKSILTVGGLIAFGLIVASAVFGFSLGLVFSGAMVILASAAILYDTSKILRNYPTDRYVGAALELFASVALLFWYVLRIMMRARR